jgi:hypothetical protein
MALIESMGKDAQSFLVSIADRAQDLLLASQRVLVGREILRQ